MKKILSAIVVVLLLSFPTKAYSGKYGIVLGGDTYRGDYAPITAHRIELENDLVDKIIDTNGLDDSLVPILFNHAINNDYSLYTSPNPNITFESDGITIHSVPIVIDESSGKDIQKGFNKNNNIHRIVNVKISDDEYSALIFPYGKGKYFYSLIVNRQGASLFKYVPLDEFEYYYESEQYQIQLDIENALDALDNAYENYPSFDSNNN